MISVSLSVWSFFDVFAMLINVKMIQPLCILSKNMKKVEIVAVLNVQTHGVAILFQPSAL